MNETTQLTDSDFETSERLRKIDAEIGDVEARLNKVEHERGQVTSDRADGVEGAQDRLDGLHDETDRLQRELRDLKAAREAETKRLANEHREAVQKANAKRLELLEADRKEVYQAAKKVDQQIGKLTAALESFYKACQKLDARRNQADARPFRTDHIADEIAFKLNDLIEEKQVRHNRARLESITPDIEEVQNRAWFPERLDDFDVANSA